MGYNEIQQKGWDILTKTEQSVLSLVIVNERSRKEASIMLGISQYKFTEIYLRARKFFLSFTEFFEKGGDFSGEELPLMPMEIEFIRELIYSRKTITQFVYGSPKYIELVSSQKRFEFWKKVINGLKLTPSLKSQLMLEIIETYDTWNSFRILPKPFQKVSPFPRRRNRTYKQMKKYIEEISEINWYIFEREFKPKKASCYIPKLQYGLEPETLAIELSQKSFRYFSKNHIPVYATQEEAKKLALFIHHYNALSQKNSYSARKFWVNFRVWVEKALNFKELMGIVPGDLLDLPLKDKLFIQKAKKQYKARKLKRSNRTSDQRFYM